MAADPIEQIRALFAAVAASRRRTELLEAAAPRRPYLIAFTPRSGSSYLCDVLHRARRLGRPAEFLSWEFVSRAGIRQAPAMSADEYVELILRARASGSGVSGFKTSWFQFENFTRAMKHPERLQDFKFIHLTRRDLAAQAVSLYRATATGRFHTHVPMPPGQQTALDQLGYDFDAISEWLRHLEVQERGWRDFFAKHDLFPLSITYEEIATDVVAVVRRIAAYLGRPRLAELAAADSLFQKIAQRQSAEWAIQFRQDRYKQNISAVDCWIQR